jgi:PAS domain S-box-containing protein
MPFASSPAPWDGPHSRRNANLFARAILALAFYTSPRWSLLIRYASALLATLVSAMIQAALFPEPAIAPFVFFYFGVALCAGIAGRGPGLLSTLISALVANKHFLAPHGAWSTSGHALIATGLFLVSGILVVIICASFRTAILQMEVASRELERRGELLRLAHDAILVWRLDGTIEFWNEGAKQLYGFSTDEALGRGPRDLLRTTPHDHWAEIEKTLREQQQWQGELSHKARDGRTVVVSSNLQLVRGEDGVERVLEANRDITDRKEAERELQESHDALRVSDRRKSEFLGMLSHELRNPLAAIRSALYVLGRSPPGSEQANRSKAVVERQVHQLTRLTDDLLDLTRISRGKIRLKPELVDLGDVVRSAVDDHRGLFRNVGVDLKVVSVDAPLPVCADVARVRQMVGNLLQNAAKFTQPGGHTVVSVDRANDFAVVTVRDDGVGIPPEVLPHLFEPFVQSEQTLDRTVGGLGLGLALVKGLAEQHRGDISAQSDGVGKGASFVLRLPLERRKAARLSLVSPLREEFARRVLVIEDNQDAAESMRDALELNGHVVEIAYAGPEGIEKARTFQPEIVLCDIGLPMMDGYQVARALRADPATHQVRLIAVSGYAQPEDLEKARSAGFDLHLAKPIDLAELETMMSQVRAAG